MTMPLPSIFKRRALIAMIIGTTCIAPAYADSFVFTPGDLVVSVEGDGSNTGSYTDNQAAPITLDEFSLNGTTSAFSAGSMMLPTVASGSNYAISGEYGSSSEGSLSLSGNGQYLTIMGYGVSPTAYNSNPSAYGNPTGNSAEAQSTSALLPRVVALVGANGSVDTSTALTNVFSGNNPRSVYTVDGSSFYVSGQGTSGDNTGGVFYATRGSTTATSITGADAGSGSSQDTRSVMAYNGSLYVSVDSKSGSTNRDFIGTLGTAGTLPTSQANGGAGPTQLTGFGTSTGKITLTAASANNVNSGLVGSSVNISPENYYFANATTLYVADSGAPKQTSGSSTLGDGGLQKWSLINGTWQLDYTLSAGLNLVANTSTSGTTGLLGLAGKVVGGQVELYATNYTVGDTDQTYLFGISDSLSSLTAQSGESFSLLETAAADSNFKGVAFAPAAPVPLPASIWLLGSGLAGLLGSFVRRQRTAV